MPTPNGLRMGIVNRNARRKRSADVLKAWQMFLFKLEHKYGHRKANLIMHTDPLDNEGPNLYKVVENLDIENNVFFSNQRLEFEIPQISSN